MPAFESSLWNGFFPGQGREFLGFAHRKSDLLTAWLRVLPELDD